jgi:hypothetical protein
LAVINEYYNTQILHFRVGLAYISKSLHLIGDVGMGLGGSAITSSP